MGWLDPDEVPTLGDWFRAGGYQTHYRGKWHVSHADLLDPRRPREPHGLRRRRPPHRRGGGGVPQGGSAQPVRVLRVDRPRAAWAAKSDCGTVRDGVFAEQVVELFGELAQAASDGPWLAVASFVNPHDIAFAGGLYKLLLGFDPSDDTVPDIPEAPSQGDSFAGRPACQEQFKQVWPQMIAEQPADLAYRQLYYYLHKVVDQAIGRILDSLEASGMADDTIVVFTSDHGDLLGAHGGMQQKWCNAFDEATHVPLVVRAPASPPSPGAITSDQSRRPDPHPDGPRRHRRRAGRRRGGRAPRRGPAAARPRPQRPHHRARPRAVSVAEPVYFMTEDDITRGLNQTNLLTGKPFAPVEHAVEHRVGHRHTADRRRRHRRAVEAQPLLRTPRRLERRPRHHAEPVRRAGRRAGLRDAQPHRRPRGASQPRRATPRRARASCGPSSTPSATPSDCFPHRNPSRLTGVDARADHRIA